MRQIVIVIADLYFPRGEGEGQSTGASAESLPGFEHAARFGEKSAIEEGWRAWLARWLGREDFANATPATVAAAALDRHAAVAAAALDRDAGVYASPPSSAATHAAPTLAPTSAVQSAASDLNAGTATSADVRPQTRGGARPSASSIDTPTPSSTAWIATPVHLIAGLTSLHLDRRSLLRLSRDDLESFARDFTAVFAESGFALEPLASGEFLMFGPNTPRTLTTEPARALVGDLGESLPKGADAPVLKRLGAELEMWLHEHPVNEARRRRGEPPVSTLWLWGGGPAVLSRRLSRAARKHEADVAPAPGAPALHEADSRAAPRTNAAPGSGAPAPSGADSHAAPRTDVAPSPTANATRDPDPRAASSTDSALDLAFGPDPYVAGLWHLNGGKALPLPDQLVTVFSYPRALRAAVVAEVAPMLHANPQWTVFDALAELDRRWVSPALAALRRGEVESVVLVGNDRQLTVRRYDRLKLWRRSPQGIEALR